MENQYGIELNGIVRDTYAKIITGMEPIDYMDKQQNAWMGVMKYSKI